MEHQVHRRDPQHGRVEVEAVEHVVFHVLAVLFQPIAEVRLAPVVVGDRARRRRVLLQQVLQHAHEEAGRAAGRIRHRLVGLGLEQLDHEADDVPRGAKLAVDARRRELAEQVLVEVALGVALVERQGVDHVHRRDQEARLLDHELRVLHVLGEGRAALELAEVREDLVAHHREHLLRRRHVPHLTPAEVLLLGPEDRLVRLLGELRPLLVPGLGHVEQPREHQEGDLLDHRERVGDPARPELLPQLVDVALELAGDHEARLLSGAEGGTKAARIVTSSSTWAGSVKTPSIPPACSAVKGAS